MTETAVTIDSALTPVMRDAEAGQRALEEIQELLHRFEVESDLVSREASTRKMVVKGRRC